ncbi:hypothetical protein [Brevibacterium linens]|uniref:hypothetical protein n=1 Tax=Brevibacterium linens TaxID=1703 RepID=UPI003F8A8FCE
MTKHILAEAATRRTGLARGGEAVLATSPLCCIVGYFPIVPADHFRYTFWPALAVTVAFVLGLAQLRIQRVRKIGP